LDDEANLTFLQEHGVNKYRGHITGIAGEALGSSNAQPYFSSRVRMGPWTTEEEEEQARFNLILILQCSLSPLACSRNPRSVI
jgi:hypothetical protein